MVFGARGDLAKRKLLPALYQLDKAGLLAESTRIAAIAREAIDSVAFIQQTSDLLKANATTGDWDEKVWTRFSRRLHYIKIDFSQKKEFASLREWIVNKRTMIYYLATPPSLFGPISKHLHDADCVASTSRIVLEKPIGHDLQSSEQVNGSVGAYFTERNIYRIDHYLGKETVQNLLALRFANRMINSQWDNSCIDHVQITAAETVGIEGRWSYYDKVGQLRDMVQNHLLQLLCMVAMEPPSSLQADEIRAEKVKLLRALRPINEDKVEDVAVRGQYSAGWISGVPVVGYMEEEGSESDSSNNETYVALKVNIDNWRWAGVPFYLRTGKRMPRKVSEIVIFFKRQPHNLFKESFNQLPPNKLTIRLQPDEGVEVTVMNKVPGLTGSGAMNLQKSKLNLSFSEAFNKSRIPDAYEKLLLEVMIGDQSLFVRRDEVEEAWKWVDGIFSAWKASNEKPEPYQAGTWGPVASIAQLAREDRAWYESRIKSK